MLDALPGISRVAVLAACVERVLDVTIKSPLTPQGLPQYGRTREVKLCVPLIAAILACLTRFSQVVRLCSRQASLTASIYAALHMMAFFTRSSTFDRSDVRDNGFALDMAVMVKCGQNRQSG